MIDFSFQDYPFKVELTVSVIQNVIINPVREELVDLRSVLSNDTHWAKLSYIPSNIQATIDLISSIPKPIPTDNIKQWIEHSVSIITIVISAGAVALLVVLIYYIGAKMSKSMNLTITIHSIKLLQD